MLHDKLKLNDDKTEFVLIGTRQQLDKVSFDTIKVWSSVISSVTVARDLGVWLDANLTMSNHIWKACASTSYMTFEIPVHVFQRNVGLCLYYRIDYCISFLYGIPNSLGLFLKRPCNFQARKAIHETMTRLPWKAALLICSGCKERQNNCQFSRLERRSLIMVDTTGFLSPEKFPDVRETTALSWPYIFLVSTWRHQNYKNKELSILLRF